MKYLMYHLAIGASDHGDCCVLFAMTCHQGKCRYMSSSYSYYVNKILIPLNSSDLIIVKKTSLIFCGTRTEVLAESMAIAVSALNHCAT